MTIILTWFKEDAIYMIADAAITDEATGNIIKLNQLKLIEHPSLNAGISWYGRSKINNQSMTKWIKQLIQESSDVTTIKEFADYIKQKINEQNTTINSGVHIAGFENDGAPAFHHITNNHANNIVTPDIKTEFIDSGISSNRILPDYFVVNGVGYPFKVIIMELKRIAGFEDYLSNIIDTIKLSLFQQNVNLNFEYNNTPQGFLNKILFYLHITQWLHLYSEQLDFIGGKYSTLISYKSPPRKEFEPNGNEE